MCTMVELDRDRSLFDAELPVRVRSSSRSGKEKRSLLVVLVFSNSARAYKKMVWGGLLTRSARARARERERERERESKGKRVKEHLLRPKLCRANRNGSPISLRLDNEHTIQSRAATKCARRPCNGLQSGSCSENGAEGVAGRVTGRVAGTEGVSMVAGR